jgi:hypothetical protein
MGRRLTGQSAPPNPPKPGPNQFNLHPTPTPAEETRNPRKDLPIGILGSVLCVTVLYTLMATTLVLMVPGKTLETLAKASFAAVSCAPALPRRDSTCALANKRSLAPQLRGAA